MESTIQDIHEIVGVRRSSGVKRSIISNDYIVYLQESVYDIRPKDDLNLFSQAMSEENFTLWYDAMKRWNPWLKIKFEISLNY